MSCVIPKCPSGKGGKKPQSGVTMHIFPRDPKKMEMWIRAIPREEWTPTKHSVVCSLHFEESDFKTEREDTNTRRKNKSDLVRRCLRNDAIPSKFPVTESERCCVASCRRISNVHPFPTKKINQDQWIDLMRKYLGNPDWALEPWHRLCSLHFSPTHVYKSRFRGDTLSPLAIPVLDREVFPPDMVKEIPIVDFPERITNPCPNTTSAVKNQIKAISNTGDLNIIYLKEEPAPKFRTYTNHSTSSAKQDPLIQTDTLKVRPLKNSSQNPNESSKNSNLNSNESQPVILMRAKGNPGILIEVEAQLWSSSGKLPKLPSSANSSNKKSKNSEDLQSNNDFFEESGKDREMIEKLKSRIKLYQKQLHEVKNKYDRLTKSLGEIFNEDQLSFLSSGGPIKRPSQWSDKTFAKAFKLRLTCGNQAYNFLLEEGYPLPSTKAMQRHIKNVSAKLEQQQQQHLKEIHPQICPITFGEHVVPVIHQHEYVIQPGTISQQNIVVEMEPQDAESNQDSDGENDEPKLKHSKLSEIDNPNWYQKLSQVVRRKIMFPDKDPGMRLKGSGDDPTTSVGQIFLSSDIQYATSSIEVGVISDPGTSKSNLGQETPETLSAESRIMHLGGSNEMIQVHVLDESNHTLRVLNMDQDGMFSNT